MISKKTKTFLRPLATFSLDQNALFSFASEKRLVYIIQRLKGSLRGRNIKAYIKTLVEYFIGYLCRYRYLNYMGYRMSRQLYEFRFGTLFNKVRLKPNFIVEYSYQSSNKDNYTKTTQKPKPKPKAVPKCTGTIFIGKHVSI